MRIARLTPSADHLLHIEADNGWIGLFDVSPYLDLEAFRPLRDVNEFYRVRNGHYFIEWDCGADLSADTIFAKWKPMPSHPSHDAHRNDQAQLDTPAA